MVTVLTNIITAVENVREVQSQKLDTTTKIQLYGQPKAMIQDGNNKAVKVDTSAIFVATPDGILHKRVDSPQGIQYAPVINQSSYYPVQQSGKSNK